MKLRIEVIEDGQQEEIVVRCREIDGRIQSLQRFLQTELAPALTFYKGEQEYYFPLENVLFFETNEEKVYAHTYSDMYRVRYRLYELEELLPRQFIRVAKAVILNARHVYSVQRNIASASLVQFHNSHKQVYVSRHYYQALKQCMEERGRGV